MGISQESAMPAASVQRLLRNGLQYARLRVEILELEIGAERQRLGAIMKFGLVLSLSALTTIQFAAMLLLALYWDTPWRLHAVGALIVVAAIATGLAWRALHHLQRETSRPLAAALRDIEQLAGAEGDSG